MTKSVLEDIAAKLYSTGLVGCSYAINMNIVNALGLLFGNTFRLVWNRYITVPKLARLQDVSG